MQSFVFLKGNLSPAKRPPFDASFAVFCSVKGGLLQGCSQIVDCQYVATAGIADVSHAFFGRILKCKVKLFPDKKQVR